MDQQAYEAARAAYQQGDWARTVSALSTAKEAGTVSGAVDHLRGNALMKLGLYSDAAEAYAAALEDVTYGKVGALCCNQGRALLAAGDLDGAIDILQRATRDPEYATPYKVFMSLGNAYLKRGNVREAGIAFRHAAIDEANPDPSSALIKLGDCFMKLGRPVDAVEAFRTALDFSTPLESQNKIFASLGSAYVAANRMSEAIDAYAHATADGSYELTAEERTSLEAAKKAVAAITGGGVSETDAFLAAAGYGSSGAYDPLDPLGKSGEMMPSPEDTGFFEVTEAEIMEMDNRSMRKKRKGGCLRAFLVLFLLALLLAAAAGFAYFRGFGWPTQEAAVTGLFEAEAAGRQVGDYLAPSLADDAKAQIETLIPSQSTVRIDGVDRSMTSSQVRCTATLPQGGQQSYRIELVRDGIGWKVADVDLIFQSEGDSGVSVDSGTVDAQNSQSETSADTATDASADAVTEENVTSEQAGNAAGGSAAAEASSSDSADSGE